MELKRKSFKRMYSRDTLATEDEDEGKVSTCVLTSDMNMNMSHRQTKTHSALVHTMGG